MWCRHRVALARSLGRTLLLLPLARAAFQVMHMTGVEVNMGLALYVGRVPIRFPRVWWASCRAQRRIGLGFRLLLPYSKASIHRCLKYFGLLATEHACHLCGLLIESRGRDPLAIVMSTLFACIAVF